MTRFAQPDNSPQVSVTVRCNDAGKIIAFFRKSREGRLEVMSNDEQLVSVCGGAGVPEAASGGFWHSFVPLAKCDHDHAISERDVREWIERARKSKRHLINARIRPRRSL